MTRTCTECGTEFRTNDNRMIHCSNACRQRAYRKRVAAERTQIKDTGVVVPPSISAKLKLIARLAAELAADVETTSYVDADEVMTAKQATVSCTAPRTRWT